MLTTEWATAVQSVFSLTDHNAPDIVTLSPQLDSVPPALDLRYVIPSSMEMRTPMVGYVCSGT
jgi:hypothetical protein